MARRPAWSIPGIASPASRRSTNLKPVKKFTSRKAAVARIWAAVARLSPDVAPPAADVAPAKGKAKKSPAKAPRRARAQKGAMNRAATRKRKSSR